MIVQEKHVVTLTYQLKNDNGELLDQTTEEKPFAFIHGLGMTLPAFDAGLQGKSAGDTFEFSIEAANGYGEYNDQNIAEVPLDVFAEAPEGTLVVGASLPMQFMDPNGNPQTAYGAIVEITDAAVVMDFNHPLAGQNLNFSGTILEVREATNTELDHGHVHGPGGHHH